MIQTKIEKHTKYWKRVLKKYDEEIRLNPKHDGAYRVRGNAKYQLKQYEKAIKDYDESIRLYPTAAAYYHRGNAKIILGQYEEAIKDYDKSIDLDPNYGNAHHNRRIAKYKLEQRATNS